MDRKVALSGPALDRALREIGTDFKARAIKYLEAKIYSQPRRHGYQRTKHLMQSLRVDTSRLPDQIWITAGTDDEDKADSVTYAKPIEFVDFKYAGDLSFMSPTYEEFVEGINGFEPVRSRLAKAVAEA